MGLDMYLNKESYVGWNYEHNRKEVKIPDLSNFGIDVKKVTCITEEVGYWRKVNAIHDWFVKNVQDGTDNCERYFVSGKKLKELLETCKQVMENKELATELLPPRSGFFFGDTEYDESYFRSILDTIQILEENEKYFENANYVFYYQSSW